MKFESQNYFLNPRLSLNHKTQNYFLTCMSYNYFVYVQFVFLKILICTYRYNHRNNLRMNFQRSRDLQPIVNTKFPDKPEIIQVKFCDYIIRYLNDKTGKKFFIEDLLDQYAKNRKDNASCKDVNDYLECGTTPRTIDLLNDDYIAEYIRQCENDANKVRKRPTIEKYSLDGYGVINNSSTYILSEELFVDCLYYIDSCFATRVNSFLSNLRNEDNDKLRLTIDELKSKNNELTTIVNKFETKNKELTDVNNKLEIKNKELTDINNGLKIKNKELTDVNNELEIKNKQLDNLTKTLSNKFGKLIKVNEDIQSELNKLNQVNEELELKTQELIQVRNNLRNQCVSPYNGTDTWSVTIELTKITKFNQIKIQLRYVNEADENIQNLSLRSSLFCLMHIPCGYDIRYYCLDKFQNILEFYHGVKTTSRSYTMNLRDYLDTFVDISNLDFDTCSYYDLKPKQELLTELKDMIETTVKDNHWNDTKLLCMFS